MAYYFDLARALSFCCLCSDNAHEPKSRRRNGERRFNPLEEDVYEPPVLLHSSRPRQVTQVQPHPVSVPSARDNRLSGLPPYTPRPVPLAMPPAYRPDEPRSPTARYELSAVTEDWRALIQRQFPEYPAMTAMSAHTQG